jgi:hypothetical protein
MRWPNFDETTIGTLCYIIGLLTGMVIGGLTRLIF